MSSPLKRLRKATDMSAYAFAKEAGMSTQNYWHLEQGERDMRMSTAVNLSRVLASHLKRSPASVLAELTEVNEQPATAA